MYLPENWADIEQPGLRKVFDGVLRQQSSNLPALFSMETSQKVQEFDLSTDDKSNWEPLAGDIKYDDEVAGYKTTYTHIEYVSGKKIQRRLLADDLYGVVVRRPRMMAIGANRRRERDGAGLFNNAFASSQLGGDGVALCSASHPSKQDPALLRSNTGTLPLTEANVEATRRNMIQIKSGANEIVDVNPDMLIVPLALEQTTWELLNSKGKVETAQNNANFHLGKYKMLVWPNYLTGPKRWFMVDSTYMKEFLLWFNREPIQFFKDRDFGTLIAAFAGYMRYSFGWSDWPWVWGNNPA